MRTSLPLLALALLASPVAAGVMDPTRVPASAPAKADAYSEALDASARLKEAAPGTLSVLRNMPLEFANVTKVVAYAGELPNTHHIPELAPTLAAKRDYWTRHHRALGKRLGELAAEEASLARSYRERSANLGNSIFDRNLGLEQSGRHFNRNLALHGEKSSVTAALARVEAVLADIAADEKGADSGQAVIDRKIALYETLRR